MHNARLTDIYTLIRFPVSLVVTFTSFTAMIMATGEIAGRLVFASVNLFWTLVMGALIANALIA